MSSAKSFDYVVIGAGASGSVVAGRISANSDATVMILEAGPIDPSSDFNTLCDFVKLWGSDVDWKFQTEAQAGLGGRQLIINQGKVMGGGSSINAMMHVRGNARNYDYWNYLGNDGWSYADVLPYFKKMEDYEGGESDVHGVGWPPQRAPGPGCRCPLRAVYERSGGVGV
jgi:choline dehydrogenase